MSDTPPGLNTGRLAALCRQAVARCRLDLRGRVVLTEAATGAYVVTPVLAALAGAERVYALTRPTRYGSVAEVTAQTLELADLAGVARQIDVITAKTPDILARANIVTNSGHVRPLDGATVGQLRPGAVIPLMYEAWELRPGDVDLEACRWRGVAVAGTNERHPAVGVFDYLGIMAVKLLLDAGVAVYGSTVLLLCDNPFGPYIEAGLRGAGARVQTAPALGAATLASDYDALLVARTPGDTPALDAADAVSVAERAPGAVVAQFWGDLDRSALLANGVPVWPAKAPAPGHMGILPSAVGPEPIVRLQAGGLKVGEVLLRWEQARAQERDFVDCV